MIGLCFPAFIIAFVFLAASIKIVNEYERGVKFRLGKYAGLMSPGLRLVIPPLESWQRVDIRVNAIDVPKQDTMTKDNVSVMINAVLYFRVADPKLAVLEVQDYYYATSQIAQTTMRNVVGEITLDELLGQRDSTSKKIKELVDKATDPWGIKIESVEIKDVELPADLIRVIGKEAEAERERRAVIIKAEGEYEAAKSFVKAAKKLMSTKGALHIRTMQTINNLGNEKSITKVYAIPSELYKQIAELLSSLKK